MLTVSRSRQRGRRERRVRCLPAGPLLVAMIHVDGCGDVTDKIYRTYLSFDPFRQAVQAFSAENDTLPESVEQMCQTMPDACAFLPVAARRNDAWGHPIVYTRGANAFELRSYGPDAKPGTQDDLVFTPLIEAAALARLSGCYGFDTQWWDDLASDILVLDTLPSEMHGEYRASPYHPPYRWASWRPLGPEMVAVVWWAAGSVVELLGVGAGDSLVARAHFSTDLAVGPWRTRQTTMRRAECPQRDGPMMGAITTQRHD